MKLGQLFDGLVAAYNIFKRNKTTLIQPEIQKLKRLLKESHERLPPSLQIDYRKKKLGTRETDLKKSDAELYDFLVKKSKQGIEVAVAIYHSLVTIQSCHLTIIELACLFGRNTEFGKYFFRKIHLEEDRVYILEIVTANSRRLLLPLHTGKLTIGRRGTKGDDVLIIDDHLISRPHCQIVRDRSQISVADLHSRNGTYINGTLRHDPVALASGDEVRLGETSIKLQIIKRVEVVDTLEMKISTIQPKPVLPQLPGRCPRYLIAAIVLGMLLASWLFILTGSNARSNSLPPTPSNWLKTAHRIGIVADTPILPTNGQKTFTAIVYDKNNRPLPQAKVKWNCNRGTISATGLYRAPASPGRDTVTAFLGELHSQITVQIRPATKRD